MHLRALPADSPPSPPRGVNAWRVAGGDIVQFESAIYRHPYDGWDITTGAPMHSAVVVGWEKGGKAIEVLEQNISHVKKVVEGESFLEDVVGGEMLLYIPVQESWAKLEATWKGWREDYVQRSFDMGE